MDTSALYYVFMKVVRLPDRHISCKSALTMISLLKPLMDMPRQSTGNWNAPVVPLRTWYLYNHSPIDKTITYGVFVNHASMALVGSVHFVTGTYFFRLFFYG